MLRGGRRVAPPCDRDCRSRPLPVDRVRSKTDRRAYRPTIGPSSCDRGRDPAPESACRRRRFWPIQTHEPQGAPATALATSTPHQPSSLTSNAQSRHRAAQRSGSGDKAACGRNICSPAHAPAGSGSPFPWRWDAQAQGPGGSSRRHGSRIWDGECAGPAAVPARSRASR